MRQMALIAIMAQVGSFVPADSADLPIFDQIFTRIGAADDLISGQSTFMVEMSEANEALQLLLSAVWFSLTKLVVVRLLTMEWL